MIRQRGKGTQVMVYAGRDPLTGRKRWVSRQVAGTGRAALKVAKQIEAQLLAEVAVGRHQDAQGVKSPSWSTAGWNGARRSSPCPRERPPTTDAAST